MTVFMSTCRPEIQETLERARADLRVSAQEAYALAHTTSSELLALLQVADSLRARYHGDVITYSRKVFLPLTNLCRDYCGYCTFRKDPGEPGAKTMTPDEVLEVVTTGKNWGVRKPCSAWAISPRRCFPRCGSSCNALDIAAPWNTWQRCASSCLTIHR